MSYDVIVKLIRHARVFADGNDVSFTAGCRLTIFQATQQPAGFGVETVNSNILGAKIEFAI